MNSFADATEGINQARKPNGQTYRGLSIRLLIVSFADCDASGQKPEE
jgi:hypothetical protein